MRRVLLFVLILAGCSEEARREASPLRRQEFIRWTRLYEWKMGLPPHEVTFVQPGEKRKQPWNAYSGGYLYNRVFVDGDERSMVRQLSSTIGRMNPPPPAWIEYDLTYQGDSERDLAVHEVCHQRMRHHEMDPDSDPLMRKLMEDEVDVCVGWYR
jgi:hypothetical protein